LDIFLIVTKTWAKQNTHPQTKLIKILIGNKESKVKFFRQWPLIVSRKVFSRHCARHIVLSLLSDGIQFFVEISRQKFVITNTGNIRAWERLSICYEMFDMACESYEVCRKEPFGISIAAFDYCQH